MIIPKAPKRRTVSELSDVGPAVDASGSCWFWQVYGHDLDMPRLRRTYLLAMTDGRRIPLQSTNFFTASKEALELCGGRLEHHDAPLLTPEKWRNTIAEIRRGTTATEEQVESLMRIPGVGVGTCAALAKMVGTATMAGVRAQVRGVALRRTAAIVAILNGTSIPEDVRHPDRQLDPKRPTSKAARS